MAPPPAPPGLSPAARNRAASVGGQAANGNDDDGPEPPAVVGQWTFAMKGMFPTPRPWNGSHKTYASGNTTGAGIGFKA